MVTFLSLASCGPGEERPFSICVLSVETIVETRSGNRVARLRSSCWSFSRLKSWTKGDLRKSSRLGAFPERWATSWIGPGRSAQLER